METDAQCAARLREESDRNRDRLAAEGRALAEANPGRELVLAGFGDEARWELEPLAGIEGTFEELEEAADATLLTKLEKARNGTPARKLGRAAGKVARGVAVQLAILAVPFMLAGLLSACEASAQTKTYDKMVRSKVLEDYKAAKYDWQRGLDARAMKVASQWATSPDAPEMHFLLGVLQEEKGHADLAAVSFLRAARLGHALSMARHGLWWLAKDDWKSKREGRAWVRAGCLRDKRICDSLLKMGKWKQQTEVDSSVILALSYEELAAK